MLYAAIDTNTVIIFGACRKNILEITVNTVAKMCSQWSVAHELLDINLGGIKYNPQTELNLNEIYFFENNNHFSTS